MILRLWSTRCISFSTSRASTNATALDLLIGARADFRGLIVDGPPGQGPDQNDQREAGQAPMAMKVAHCSGSIFVRLARDRHQRRWRAARPLDILRLDRRRCGSGAGAIFRLRDRLCLTRMRIGHPR